MKKLFSIIFVLAFFFQLQGQVIKLTSQMQSIPKGEIMMSETKFTFNLDEKYILIHEGKDHEAHLMEITISGVLGEFALFFTENDPAIKSVAMGGGNIGTKAYTIVITYRKGDQIVFGLVDMT